MVARELNVVPDSQPETRRLAPCNAWLAALWVLRRLRRYRVAGASMEPSLHEGQSVLLNPRAYSTKAPCPGDVLLLRHPTRAHLITVKRLAYVQGDGVYVLGDNAESSTDSRHYGLVPITHLLGRIECTFP